MLRPFFTLILTFISVTLLFLKAHADPLPHSKSAPPPIHSTDDLIAFYLNSLSDGQFKAMVPDASITSEYGLLHYVENAPESVRVSPWMGSMSSSLIVREFFYQKEMESIFDRSSEPFIKNNEGSTNLTSAQERRDFLSGKDQSWSITHQKIKILQPSLSSTLAHSRETGLSSSSLARYLACFRANPLTASTCLQILREVEALMSPVDYITAIPMINTVLYNTAYTEGLSRAALKIMDKVEEVRKGKIVRGDLFTDIFNSFVDVGIETEKAEEMTWTALAVYSSRGPNMYRLYPYIPSISAARSILSLQTIAMAVSVLDAARYDSGHLYSLPQTIKLHAPYGKPYHFWMSAFLSRKMNQQFKDPESVRKAISMVEFAYQLFSETKGRENLLQEVSMGGAFHPATSKVRIDLVIGFAGASYGVLSPNERNQVMDLDQITQKSLRKASRLSPLNPNSAFQKQKMFLRWIQYLKPYSLMEDVRFKVDCNGLLTGNVLNESH